jgi:hypothetical protein
MALVGLIVLTLFASALASAPFPFDRIKAIAIEKAEPIDGARLWINKVVIDGTERIVVVGYFADTQVIMAGIDEVVSLYSEKENRAIVAVFMGMWVDAGASEKEAFDFAKIVLKILIDKGLI